jgi:hypothetical protein
MSTSEREGYSDRLWGRLAQTVGSEAPEGIGRIGSVWESVEPSSAELFEVNRRFREGEAEKEALDQAAVRVLGEWRKQFRLHSYL